MSYEFTHDIQGPKDMRSAVQTARHHLVLHARRHNYNMMLSEG